MENATGQGAGNPLLIYGYTFVPKSLGARRAPLIVLVHGGVHGNFGTTNAHIVRELLEQGYVIVAPEYRGSAGYGGDFYEQIDYGGGEIDDTHDLRNWAVQNLPQVDPKKVGIVGWSHGGLHTLFNVFNWPEDYQVAYAGVPVSDLVQRMGYKSQSYRDIFKEFIGKEAADNPAEYRKRSPVNHVDKLRTPLLVHTNTNDEDVNVMEVEHLIEALKASRQVVRIQDSSERAGRAHLQRDRHQAGPRIEEGDLGVPGQVSQVAGGVHGGARRRRTGSVDPSARENDERARRRPTSRPW
jgi:dipeptidyl aminopeptidase/acylaminoacyl peptidase